jgi:hypothetical protein
MWAPHVLFTYECYEYSWHTTTIIYLYTGSHSMGRFIMKASYAHISDSIDARVEKVHPLNRKCHVQHNYACVHIPHESRSKLTFKRCVGRLSMHDRLILVIQSILTLSKYTCSLTVGITFNVIMHAYPFDMSRTIKWIIYACTCDTSDKS